MLNASRAVQGIGAAIMFAVSLALLSNAFPDRRRSAPRRSPPTAPRSAPSFAVGPLVGGALTSGLDWRLIFLVNLPLGLLCLGDHAALRRGVEGPATPAASTWPGQITLTAGLFLLVLALLRGNDDGWTSATIVAALVGAVAFLERVHRRSRRASRSRCCRSGCSASAPFTGAQVGGVRDLGLVLRRVHLHDALPAADPRAVGDPGRPRLPAGHDDHAVRRRPATANLVAEARRAPHGRRRAAARGHRPGAADGRRGRLLVDRVPARRDHRADRHRHLQPGRLPARAGLRAAGDERPGRRRQRHVPPGRHRRRRRRAGRARARRARVRRRRPDLRRRHAGRAVGRRRPLRRRRRSRAPRCWSSAASPRRPASSRSTPPSPGVRPTAPPAPGVGRRGLLAPMPGT